MSSIDEILERSAKARSMPLSVCQLAAEIRSETPAPEFTDAEKRILLRVFSNADRNTFFIRGLPEPLVTVLMAMYSRIKNPRGIRGVFIDNLLKKVPAIGKIFLSEEYLSEGESLSMLLKQLSGQLLAVAEDLEKNDKISEESWNALTKELDEMVAMGWNLERQYEVVSADKTRDFLTMFLDKFGHNSIARMGIVHVCCERISTIAAKAIESGRPGVGYIELSTRYVDVSTGSLYPIWRFAGGHEDEVRQHIEMMLGQYQKHWEEQRAYWLTSLAPHLSSDEKERELQITGKLGDTDGNLLPCAFLTSVGISAQGEAFAKVVEHLLLDGTPEALALAAEIYTEAENSGDHGLLRHFEPAKSDLLWLKTLPAFTVKDGDGCCSDTRVDLLSAPNSYEAEAAISFLGGWPFNDLMGHLGTYRQTTVDSHDKLPRALEAISVVFGGGMSFRTWRDLSRQGFCTHFRSLINPDGPYFMPSDVSESYRQDARRAAALSREIATKCRVVPGWNPYLTQYLANLGTMVHYTMAANLRQMEFLIWQRTGWGAHFEVRRHAAAMYRLLCKKYPWWNQVSRADTTEYLFARGQTKVPRPETVPIEAVPVS